MNGNQNQIPLHQVFFKGQQKTGCSFCGASRFDSLHSLGGCKFCTGAGIAVSSKTNLLEHANRVISSAQEIEERRKRWIKIYEDIQNPQGNRASAT